MKKTFLVAMMIVAMLVSVLAFAACNEKRNEPNVDVEYTLVAPDGAPALAIANLPTHYLIDETVYGVNKKVVNPLTLQTEAVQKDVDMAIVPANLAATIFNKSGGYKVLAVVTDGNLYMTSSIRCEVSSLRDLESKIVYSIGQNQVPDMIFRTLLANAGLKYEVGEEAKDGRVTVKYCGDGQEVIGKLGAAKSKGKLAFGIYGEPAVNASKAKGFEEVFDLQSLWAQAESNGAKGYAQAVLIARDKVCEDSAFAAKLMEAFTANDSAILQDASQAIKNIKDIYPQSSLQDNMTAEVIGRCNIKTVKIDAENRAFYENTLKAVMNINANLIGGKLPSDDFYIA